MTDLHEKIANSHPSLSRGKVWCKTCRREQPVNSADALKHGWPKCCGYTMTIDHPDTWEADHLKQRAEAAERLAGARVVITPEMVNAAWNKGKDMRMTGLPSDFRNVLEAAIRSLKGGRDAQ